MRKSTNHKGGFAALAVLVTIVIIALLYMIDLTAIFGPTGNIDPYAERPWFEDKRLVAKEALPIKQTGKKGKVVIREQTVLTGEVESKNEKRGNFEIVIEPNGLAKGHWDCAYEYTDSKSKYTITAEFTGNIDPLKTYEDKTGKNKQLLYFITKGKYTQTKTDPDGNQWPNRKVIYVVGWIHPVRDKAPITPDDRQKESVSNGIRNDYSAKGKLFLMTADGGNGEYDWQTK
ncbi:MAG: hypothetical protein WC496_00170 [Phycisphaerae bacterium]